MLLWNRKEVYVGNSLNSFNALRDKLSSNQIKYEYKIVDNSSSNRSRTGTYGLNMDFIKTYYLYVHKFDYDYAQQIIK